MVLSPLFDDIPDQTGKVAIVTGGNAGIGKITCKVLLERGAKVYMGARSKEKAEEAIAELKKETGKENIFWLQLDLASLASVQEAVKQFLSQETNLHILVNNAGIMAVPYALTTDGYEVQWGTNVVGHFALTKLLIPTLQATASSGPVRVINVSSDAHALAPGINFEDLGLKDFWFAEWRRYGQSKLGNILLTKEIARKYGSSGIISISLHPGVIKTQLHTNTSQSWRVTIGLMFTPKPISEEEGAYTQIFAATSERVITENMNGLHMRPMGQVARPKTKDAEDGALATKLWDYLEKDLAAKGI